MAKDKIIIHVDMDAFYAAVEARDNHELKGKALIIGSLPDERGVVATCSYEARKYGVRSGMNIKEAYRLCPNGVYMHPNMDKYANVSEQIHEIWKKYTDIIEFVALDEGYLDVTSSEGLFGGALNIANEIKEETKQRLGLICSVGIGYSMQSAKLASEEKKPDGLFFIPDKEFLYDMIKERDIRVIYGIGKNTAEKLREMGIVKVKDILPNARLIANKLGKHGRMIIDFANGTDGRDVTPYYKREAQSIGRETTFQKDISDFKYLKNVLLLLSKELSLKLKGAKEYAETITLKVKYKDMHSVTKSHTGNATDDFNEISKVAGELLDICDRKPVRLVGITLSNFTDQKYEQISFADLENDAKLKDTSKLDESIFELQKRFGAGIIKTGSELEAEKINDD